jgi:hypothetical protein
MKIFNNMACQVYVKDIGLYIYSYCIADLDITICEKSLELKDFIRNHTLSIYIDHTYDEFSRMLKNKQNIFHYVKKYPEHIKEVFFLAKLYNYLSESELELLACMDMFL